MAAAEASHIFGQGLTTLRCRVGGVGVCFVQFHDFTTPCQDDDADAFFETCDHESLPTGESSMQHVTAQHVGDLDADAVGAQPCAISSEGGEGKCAQAELDVSMSTVTPAKEGGKQCADKENVSLQRPAASASKCTAGGKPNSKLTESIMALAGFKGKEAELTNMANHSVASASASVSPGAGEEAPISGRTRRSLEGQRKSQGGRRSQGSARKGVPSPGIALHISLGKGLKSEEKKRAHKTGSTTTPYKSDAKKPRTGEKRAVQDKESKTPIFSRFGGARGRGTDASRTPNGRSSSAPVTGRPSMTPRSARKTVSFVYTNHSERSAHACLCKHACIFSSCTYASVGTALPISARVRVQDSNVCISHARRRTHRPRPRFCVVRQLRRLAQQFAPHHLCAKPRHPPRTQPRVSPCPRARNLPPRPGRRVSEVWMARCRRYLRLAMRQLAASARAVCNR